jgi:hypothetical protein
MKQARMAKVLGCLVAAMTLGAVGLMWVEPHTTHLYPDAPAGVSAPYLLRAEAVAGAPQWQGVIIEHRFDSPGRLPLSSHPAELRRYHFIIDVDGFRQVCPSWRGQNDLPGAHGLIRIAVQAQPSASTLSMQQWESLLTLLRFLEDRYRLESPCVRLQSQPPAADAALRRQARHLTALVRAAGLS